MLVLLSPSNNFWNLPDVILYISIMYTHFKNKNESVSIATKHKRFQRIKKHGLISHD